MPEEAKDAEEAKDTAGEGEDKEDAKDGEAKDGEAKDGEAKDDEDKDVDAAPAHRWDLNDIGEQAEHASRDEVAVLALIVSTTRHFHDLEEVHIDEEEEEDEEKEDDATLPQNAFIMTSADVSEALMDRGIAPKGFLNDDSRTLQDFFDADAAERRAFWALERQAEAAQHRARLARQRHVVAVRTALVVEADAVLADAALADWLLKIAGQQAPHTVKLSQYVKASFDPSAACRVVAKVLWGAKSITALDLSRAGLEDQAGAYVARALRSPDSQIVKLDLDDNRLSHRSCAALAQSLTAPGARLKALSVEGNLLLEGDAPGAPPGFEALCAALWENDSLTRLSLWRCGLDADAGRALAAAVGANAALIVVETGQNDITFDDDRAISAALKRNRENGEEKLRRARSDAADDEARNAADAVEAARSQKACDVEAYLARRKEERRARREADAASAEAAEAAARKCRSDADKKRRDGAAKADHDKLAKAAKKKKKGKKK
ncbi:hypothetical protein M885DRAFT_612458 [Pelagophyceae sp. CCMP2097]|nr:hypothetical protein M885DRAFT_612458 [Pelagophyceae sp. CCMP2097]|mmetsp:Transcript_10425/g.36894  ORF Transcript_10425/g.36894 Transcript_10425/m.36894 type:complete len:494 (+) Transcript_10425:101-1582(+)